ncbi:MAG: hypothetical protein LBG95_04605 [Treponema sp.]|jgi:argininosuccinate lyase|nr:hypothetical protein [Treponema sp.]
MEYRFVDHASAPPDFAELIRGKAGRSTGNLVTESVPKLTEFWNRPTLLTLLKGLPYAYDKDLQEDKESLFDSMDTLRSCLRKFRGMIGSAEFKVKKMKDACSGGFMEATDAADYLVRKGLPFRKAHEAAALIVRDCIDSGLKHIASLSLAQLKKRSKLFEEDIYGARARNLPGGPAPNEVKRQIRLLRKKIKN